MKKFFNELLLPRSTWDKTPIRWFVEASPAIKFLRNDIVEVVQQGKVPDNLLYFESEVDAFNAMAFYYKFHHKEFLHMSEAAAARIRASNKASINNSSGITESQVMRFN